MIKHNEYKGPVDPEETYKTYTISKGALWKRIGIERLALVLETAKTDSLIETLLLMISDSEYINLKDPEFLKGLEIMQAKNLLTQGDVDKLKQPAKPEELPGI